MVLFCYAFVPQIGAKDGDKESRHCRIEVVEKGSGWPVPLVELRTTNQLRFVSDNAGVIAIDAPELFDREIWFDVIGHGYEVPRDGFGGRGVRLVPEHGKTLRVEVDRRILARRVGRLTGGGILGEGQKLGEYQEWKESGVFGCDSTQTAVHRGRKFWVWGDTSIPKYTLGIFDATGATTEIVPDIEFEPPLRMPFEYFRDRRGNPRGIAPVKGDGPTWLSALVSLKDRDGEERLVASYVKIIPPLEPYEQGLVVWNEKTQLFEPLRVLWNQSTDGDKRPRMPDGHSVKWRDESGKEWVLFGNPLPTLRVAATFEAWQDPDAWELLEQQESLPSAADGRRVKPHTGAIAWNAWRNRWVTVFMEAFGSPSAFGEIWYAEADSPFGPWGPATKVLSHENYTFYNPCLHPEFTPDVSPHLYFEGTFTAMFTDHAHPTPRYDYNQMLYRLDLDDPGLAKSRGE